MRQVPDYRCGRKKRLDLAEFLTGMVMGFLAGRTTVRRCLKWCRSHLVLLQKQGMFLNGVPSAATASRFLSRVDEVMFALVFMEWIGEILNTRGCHLIIDGKALRASINKVTGTRTPMIMNVLEAATELVVAQMPIDDKGCEMTAIPKLLSMLDIEDSVITIDAIGTQTRIMEQILSQGGNFVLYVKSNQEETKEDIQEYFLSMDEETKTETKEYDCYRSEERNRERYEYREVEVSSDCRMLRRYADDWYFLKSIGRSRQIRILIERDEAGNDITPGKEEFLRNGSKRRPKPETSDEADADIQEVGLISNLVLKAKEMAATKREHWRIENGLHHVLDEAFREDKSSARKSKNNLSLVRKFAYNILRLAILAGDCSDIITEAMDDFADDLSLIEKYIFRGVCSLY